MSDKKETKPVGPVVNVVVKKPEDNPIIEGNAIVLDLVEGWEELDDRQQKFLHAYAHNPTHPKTLLAMQLGYTNTEISKWFEGEHFSNVADTIYNIYTDILKGLDFQSALTNTKIRGRVIQARENGGKYSKDPTPTTHNHLHLKDYNIRDFLKS